MRTDGSENMVCNEDVRAVRGLDVVGDWIYFISCEFPDRSIPITNIMKMRIDGSELS